MPWGEENMSHLSYVGERNIGQNSHPSPLSWSSLAPIFDGFLTSDCKNKDVE